MDFSFGIITNGDNDNYINQIIDSIEVQNIPNYEIIIVGATKVSRVNTTTIPFDESVKAMWITKKKNLITLNAKYENLVFLHDYISLTEGWYEGFLSFGDDFKVCMTKIINIDGTRFRDWTLMPRLFQHRLPNREYLLPYTMTHLSKYMYISGAYWVAKKNIMLEEPLNESLVWGQAEDSEWSSRISNKYNFSINTKSTVKVIKPNKPAVFIECSDSSLELLNNLN